MNSAKYLLFSVLLLLLFARSAYAHRPVIVKNRGTKEEPVVVKEPEISWAYYGLLEGEPRYYKIVSSEPFDLYVNILVPDPEPEGEPQERHDMSFQIFKGENLLYTGEGLDYEWHRFYEKYGKDHYYWGPEFDQRVEAGIYYVRIYNSNNRGKYSLAVGKIEKFNLFSIIGAIIKAKSLDRWFFE